MAGRHAPVNLARPPARERPPRNVEKEALAETVVAGNEVHPLRDIESHLGGRSHIMEFQALEHGSSPDE